jgi:hypothetical protein
MRRGKRSLAVVLAGVVLAPLLSLTAPAAAEDPLFVNWSEVLPGLSSGYDPSDANECKSGKIQCVDAVIREMERRLERLAGTCSHNALFALAYLRTTEEYRRAAVEPGFFEDPGFVNHEDAVFARYYFEPYDNWYQRNKRDRVPPAWRIAFEASDAKAVTGTGSVLLGISAHINRDLPFVLAEIGLVAPDGTSRKADHDKVNEFLNRVEFYEEASRRFDPSMSSESMPGTIHLIIAWREQAWRNAERLVAATTDAERAMVAKSIEDFAALEAQLIRASNSYGLLQSSAARDAHCALHGAG